MAKLKIQFSHQKVGKNHWGITFFTTWRPWGAWWRRCSTLAYPWHAAVEMYTRPMAVDASKARRRRRVGGVGVAGVDAAIPPTA